MKKLIIIVLIFILISCTTTEQTISITADSSKVSVTDSTQVVNQISEEDQLGYILVIAIVGFIVISLIGLSHIMPPPGIQ